jgi:hypothetical protein
MKPAFIYNEDGTFKDFGVGYKKKTVLPIWLIVIFLAVISYLAVLYYIMFPKLMSVY